MATPVNPTTTAAPNVDLAAVQAEVAKLSSAQLAEQLTKVRVRQKVQQKKQYAKGAMKSYQLRQREKIKAMKEAALAAPGTENDPTTGKPFANLWEQINATADKQAEEKLEEESVTPEDEETEGEGGAATGAHA
jgi:hypothetical protein